MRYLLILFIGLSLIPPSFAQNQYDLVVYGGTSAGVIASVQAARMGHSVILVSPDEHLGGLTVNGLGWTDTGDQTQIGGLSREFYERIHDHYANPDAWIYEEPHEMNQQINRGKYNPEDEALWVFEPRVAEQVYIEMLDEAGVPVVRDAWLDRKNGVAMKNGRIQSITTLDGNTYYGKTFIDATYVGDLMAAAGVSYTVGRESNEQYNEYFNGVQKDVRHHQHYFYKQVDPFLVPGDPTSGVLPRVQPGDPGDNGEGNHQVQAYCFRMCMTKVPENKAAWQKPVNYDPLQYELLLRNFEAGDWRIPLKIDMMPNKKTDTNNRGAFSTDNIGKNYNYPEATYQEREKIYQEHLTYQQGLMWTLANHPRVPQPVRQEVREWGLAANEFEDNNHWPYKLYIREARRMIGQYVMTEYDCRRTVDTPKPVGLGSYTMDSHNTQRYITSEGYVQNEGDVGVHPGGPYEISYDSLLPQKAECKNLLVPVSLSSSHIAYGSIRMEPVFMILGQSAATAAILAVKNGVAVQDVDYQQLKAKLLDDGQKLTTDAPPKWPPVNVSHLDGYVADNEAAEIIGDWLGSSAIQPYVESNYLHDDNAEKGEKSIRFAKNLKPGRYEVRMSYSANANRADNVPVTVQHAEGVETIIVNQQKTPEHGNLFTSLGVFTFSADRPAIVEIHTKDTNGHVIADAVQWLPQSN